MFIHAYIIIIIISVYTWSDVGSVTWGSVDSAALVWCGKALWPLTHAHAHAYTPTRLYTPTLIHTHRHIHTRRHIHTYVHTHAHTLPHSHIHFTHIQTYTHIHPHARPYPHARTRTSIPMLTHHARTHIHSAYTSPHAHTYTQSHYLAHTDAYARVHISLNYLFFIAWNRRCRTRLDYWYRKAAVTFRHSHLWHHVE